MNHPRSKRFGRSCSLDHNQASFQNKANNACFQAHPQTFCVNSDANLTKEPWNYFLIGLRSVRTYGLSRWSPSLSFQGEILKSKPGEFINWILLLLFLVQIVIFVGLFFKKKESKPLCIPRVISRKPWYCITKCLKAFSHYIQSVHKGIYTRMQVCVLTTQEEKILSSDRKEAIVAAH